MSGQGCRVWSDLETWAEDAARSFSRISLMTGAKFKLILDENELWNPSNYFSIWDNFVTLDVSRLVFETWTNEMKLWLSFIRPSTAWILSPGVRFEAKLRICQNISGPRSIFQVGFLAIATSFLDKLFQSVLNFMACFLKGVFKIISGDERSVRKIFFRARNVFGSFEQRTPGL